MGIRSKRNAWQALKEVGFALEPVGGDHQEEMAAGQYPDTEIMGGRYQDPRMATLK